MLGNIKKTTKRNLLKCIPWRFGPNWPGKRCEAKTIHGHFTKIERAKAKARAEQGRII